MRILAYAITDPEFIKFLTVKCGYSVKFISGKNHEDIDVLLEKVTPNPFDEIKEFDCILVNVSGTRPDTQFLRDIRNTGCKICIITITDTYGLYEQKFRADMLASGCNDSFFYNKKIASETLPDFEIILITNVFRSLGHTKNIITVGPIVINLTKRLAHFNENLIKFTPGEFDLLRIFAINKNSSVKTDTLLEYLSIHTIHSTVGHIRKKIDIVSEEIGTGETYLQTIHSYGYILSDTPRTKL